MELGIQKKLIRNKNGIRNTRNWVLTKNGIGNIRKFVEKLKNAIRNIEKFDWE